MLNRPSSPTNPSVQGEILRIEESAFDQIAEMLALSDLPATTPDFWLGRFAHWWGQNPYFGNSMRGYWVRSADRCVGFYGLIPLEFQLNGSTHIAYAGTTWRVLPSYGRFALPLLVRVMKLASDGPLFTWTRDPQVAKTLRNFKWQSIQRPTVSRWASTTLLYRSDHVNSSLLKLANLGLQAYSIGIEQILDWRVPGRLRAQRLFEVDERVDALWQRTRQQTQTMPLRDARFLGWRIAAKASGFRLYGCFDGKVLCGVLVGVNSNPRGLRMFEVADVWTDPAVAGCDLSLVQAMLRDTSRDGFDGCVCVPWNHEISRIAKRVGFLPVPISPSQEFVFLGSNTSSNLPLDTHYWGGLIGDRYL